MLLQVGLELDKTIGVVLDGEFMLVGVRAGGLYPQVKVVVYLHECRQILELILGIRSLESNQW